MVPTPMVNQFKGHAASLKFLQPCLTLKTEHVGFNACIDYCDPVSQRSTSWCDFLDQLPSTPHTIKCVYYEIISLISQNTTHDYRFRCNL